MAGAQLYLQQHGDTVAGKQIRIVLKDDASAPDVARRAAQEVMRFYAPKAKSAKREPYHPQIILLEKRELMAGGILEYSVPTSSSGPRGIAPESTSST